MINLVALTGAVKRGSHQRWHLLLGLYIGVFRLVVCADLFLRRYDGGGKVFDKS